MVIPDFDLDVSRANVRKGEDPAHRDPAIAAEAAAVIVPRLLQHPALENLFACTWDYGAERILTARWICRGSRERVAFMRGDLQAGEVALHNHPGPSWPESPLPSEQDLDAATGLVQHGIGSALVTNCLGRFVLLHPPRLPVREAEFRSWRLGSARFGVTLHRTTVRRFEP